VKVAIPTPKYRKQPFPIVCYHSKFRREQNIEKVRAQNSVLRFLIQSIYILSNQNQDLLFNIDLGIAGQGKRVKN
jgi:hypothetical protein